MSKKINSRQKGAAGEREAAIKFRRWFPHCKRMFPRQQQGVKYPDVGCPRMEPLFYVEVKRYAGCSDSQVKRWTDKMMSDYTKFNKMYSDEYDAIPILMYRPDGQKKWTVRMLFEDAIKFGERNHCMNKQVWCEYWWQDFQDAMDKIYDIKESE